MLDEAVAAVALTHSDTLLARNRSIVRDNLALLDAWVSEEKHASYVKPSAGTTALIYYDSAHPLLRPSARSCTSETGAFVTPGDCFEQPG